ncbi:MAG: hypothetical protein L6W00_21150 [Lentisphaeria bacterium]|nr:MAG: hypothetical protein L6W00_21150 [Lentisphaeria bacterium]
MEHEFENEIALFGFDRSGDTPVLRGADRIGAFLDCALPEMLRTRPGLALGSSLARMIRGSAGLPGLELNCRLSCTATDRYVVSYQLSGDGVVADWKSCAEAVRGGQEFLALSGAGLVKISAPLADFLPRLRRCCAISIRWPGRLKCRSLPRVTTPIWYGTFRGAGAGDRRRAGDAGAGQSCRSGLPLYRKTAQLPGRRSAVSAVDDRPELQRDSRRRDGTGQDGAASGAAGVAQTA